MTHPQNQAFEGEDSGGSVMGPMLVIFLVVGVLVALDVVQDLRVGGDRLHVAGESLAVLLATVGAGFAARRWRAERARTRLALAEARQETQAWRGEAERWRAEASQALKGLADAMDQQFQRWELTRAEREVALLLLKGLSFKEIGAVRDASERTVRQQAQAVYRKAGVAGRAELAAFFFEDLL